MKTSLADATISEHDGVRYLHLDSPWVQGAMRLKRPLEIELEYVKRMMAWMLLRPSKQLADGHAVQLGLGAGAITRFCHRVMKMRTTAVELNPSVMAACRTYFRLEDAARLAVIHDDAARYAADPANAGTADVLCVDLYDHDAAAPILDSAEFYADCRRLLSDDGVMSVNLFGRHASFKRSARSIVHAFPGGLVLRVQPTREGNTVVLVAKRAQAVTADELVARAQNIDTRFGLPASRWLHMIQPVELA